MEWEDIPNGPNGDFNDMMFYLQGRECSTELNGFPHMSFASGEASGIGCYDECGQVMAADCTGEPHLTANDVRFAVSVSIDSNSGEYDLEPRGRLIHVMVATYGEPGLAGTDMVVCPTLQFDRPTVKPDHTTVGYGINPLGLSPFCDQTPPNTGDPICSTVAFTQMLEWEDVLALARDQHYAVNQCSGSRTGPGDVFKFQPPNRVTINGGTTDCDLVMPHIETYEIEVDMVAAALDPVISSLTSQQILDMINGVGIKFIHEPQVAGPFYCPSGFNLIMATVQRAIGVLQNTYVLDGALNYSEQMRQ